MRCAHKRQKSSLNNITIHRKHNLNNITKPARNSSANSANTFKLNEESRMADCMTIYRNIPWFFSAHGSYIWATSQGNLSLEVCDQVSLRYKGLQKSWNFRYSNYVFLFWFNVAFNNFSVISRWCLVVIEPNAHFYRPASLKYFALDTWHDTTPSHIILTLGQPVLALPTKSKPQARSS